MKFIEPPETRDKEKWFLVSIWILIAILVMISFFIGVLYHDSFVGLFDKNTLKEVDYTENCDNMSIVDTAFCLEEELDSFFYYNISNYGRELNESQFIDEGGVCTHSTEWYLSKLKEMPFYKKVVVVDTSENKSHQFLIISNEDAYCLLDQTIADCKSFVT